MNMMPNPSIGIVIPTFQAAHHLPYCLPPLLQSPLNPRIVLIDSSSTDHTVSIAKQMKVEVLTIPKQEFNHGTTREKGRLHLKTDIVVMMTQDAYAVSPMTLGELVKPLIQQQASIAYARQIPHLGAKFFEAFPRSFNYPETSHIRSIQDLSEYGAYTFFCSNSCAAYLNKALDEVGGFPHVLFGEDTIVVAKLLHRHHKIAYVSSAEVRHSHHYSLKQEFHRHFDMGLARKECQDLLSTGGAVTKRGKAYFYHLLRELRKNHPHLIPYALVQTFIKLLGYRIGEFSIHAPLRFKKACSSQIAYWQSEK
jgi:rhamnosyltransferase